MRLHAHDHTGAEQLAVKAACAGHIFGLTELAEHHGRDRSYDHARRLYELAADYGNADALSYLAAMMKDLGDPPQRNISTSEPSTPAAAPR